MCRPTRDSIVSSAEEFATLLQILTNEDNNKQSPPRRKRVRFHNEISRSAPSNVTDEERKSMWYERQALKSFRTEAQRLVASGQQERGLERCSLKRQLRRHQTIQCILSSHKKGMTPEQTALMAKTCSEWNKELAVLQACHDYAEVHQPELVLPQICNTPPKFPFELKRSSPSSCGSPQRRRVRRRVSA